VGQLILKAKQLADAKAQVLLVYPGPADNLKARADEFVSGKDMPANFHLLLDPDYRFTNLYGLRWDAKGETAYPSTFVIRTDGKVAFAKISRGHGDRAKVEDVLAAIAE
jgi:thioredoxin-dependent peroxiredoxin